MLKILLVAFALLVGQSFGSYFNTWLIIANYSDTLCSACTTYSLYNLAAHQTVSSGCVEVVGDLGQPRETSYGVLTASRKAGNISSSISFYNKKTCANSPVSTLKDTRDWCASTGQGSFLMATGAFEFGDRLTVDVPNLWGSSLARAVLTYSDSACTNFVSLTAVEYDDYNSNISACAHVNGKYQRVAFGSLDSIIYDQLNGLLTYYKGLNFVAPPPNPAPAYPFIFTLATTNPSVTPVKNTLKMFNVSNTEKSLLSVNIKGLRKGERLFGLDVRVSNNQVYALGNYSLYTINPKTGAAKKVGDLLGCPADVFSYFQDNRQWSFNFNPQRDTITIVTVASNNWEVDPDTGACTVHQNRNYRTGAGYCGGFISYTNNLPNLPANVNSTQYTVSGYFIVVPNPDQGGCYIIARDVATDLTGPFDIYTSPSFLNVAFIIRYNTLVTFSLVDGTNQTNVHYLKPLAADMSYAALSALPPGYNPLL